MKRIVTPENMTFDDFARMLYNKICIAMQRADLSVDFKCDFTQISGMICVRADNLTPEDRDIVSKRDIYDSVFELIWIQLAAGTLYKYAKTAMQTVKPNRRWISLFVTIDYLILITTKMIRDGSV